MKFTDGYWQMRPGVTALSPRSIADIVVEDGRMVAHTPTRGIEARPVEIGGADGAHLAALD